MSKETRQATTPPPADEKQSPAAEDRSGPMTSGWTGMVNSMKSTFDSLAKDDQPIELLGRRFTIPNLLSISRLVLTPGMLLAAWSNSATLFLIILSMVLLIAAFQMKVDRYKV